SCASCWVRARRGSGETGVACFFCWFISCSRDGKLGIGSTEVESQRPAWNPWRAHEPEYAAGSAKNQLLAPQAARGVERAYSSLSFALGDGGIEGHIWQIENEWHSAPINGRLRRRCNEVIDDNG